MPNYFLDCLGIEPQQQLNPEPLTSIGFRLGGTAVLVHSNHAAIVNEVREYLEPHFETFCQYGEQDNTAGVVLWNVWISNRAAWGVPKLPGSVPVVIHATGEHPTLGRALHDPAGRLIIYNQRYNDVIIIDVKNRHVAVIGWIGTGYLYPGRHSWLASEGHNVVRHILRIEAENAGAVVVHGSVVAIGNVGIAFIGDQGAGKTTTLLTLLRRRTGAYVANDRFFVFCDEGYPRAVGWPTTCRIALGSLALFEELHHLIPEVEREPIFRVDVQERSAIRKKVLVLPKDIPPILHAPTRRSVKVSALVFLESESHGIPSFEKCELQDAERCLRSNLFSPIDHQHPNAFELERPSPVHLQASCDRAVQHLLQSVSLRRLRGHPPTAQLLEYVDSLVCSVGGASEVFNNVRYQSDGNKPEYKRAALIHSSVGYIAVPTVGE